ncbi:MAG: DUF3842 family protein [Lachnospiraceae bacterium]|nr:DUF3842 family protein [Lachnospiraceae bacterium]
MNVLVIDAQGGGVGKALVAGIKKEFPSLDVTAVGTNSIAAAAMLKAGADHAATGENAVIVCCRTADLIVGPVGIIIADAMYGEITPAMAVAVGQARAKRILLPLSHCDNIVAGVPDTGMKSVLESALAEIEKLVQAG